MHPEPDAAPEVSLRVPADLAYVATLRATAAALAARLDFTIEDIDDLKMAVSEACALVLDADHTGYLTADLRLGNGSIEVRLSADGAGPTSFPDTDGFAWQVLSTLTDSVEAGPADDPAGGDRRAIVLRLSSSALS